MVMNLSVAAILWYGARDVMEGAASPGSIMAAITYTTQLLMGIMMLMMLFQNISRGFISWKRLATVLHLEPEIQDGKFEDKDCSNVSDFSFENADAAGQRSENTTKIINTQGHIEFVNVSFTYPGSQKPVLEHINLTINPGETIAIMGSTGSGKTTLINLIPRFYDVTEGSVRIDGVDVRDYKVSSLRRRIAIALQKSELFSTSIKENIAWGRRELDETKTETATTDETETGMATPNESRGYDLQPNETDLTESDTQSNTAADADIERAARIAQAHEFIARLEQGYDTVVAERGMSLSGGQKQRIALARAVLKGSPIMIFDDATSALDLKTEANFYNELVKTSPQSTKIIVAQRIASVRRANRILILESGKIVAEGTHKELLKSCAIYQDIYQSQVGDIAQHENATQTENANTTQPKANTTSKEADASAKGGERA
jgi:ATP-binding cassette subfamily B protein